MADFQSQIADMLNGQAATAPTLLKNYGSALSTAQGQDQQSVDALRTLYSDKSKFTANPWTGFANGLIADTPTHSFGSSLATGLAAAANTQEANRVENLSREEKLAKLSALEATLTRQRGSDGIDMFQKTGAVAGALRGMQGDINDMQLSQDAKNAPRLLGPGEQGPQAPGADNLSRSMTIYNDYLRNPSKYSGEQGQSLVKNAIDLINNERTNQRYMQVAELRYGNKNGANSGQSMDKYEQARVAKRQTALDATAEDARGLKSNVSLLRAARDKSDSEGVPLADAWASGTGWFTDSGAALQDIRSKATAMKLALSTSLKGAISDKEQVMLGQATPGVNMSDAAAGPVLDAYDAVAERQIERSKFMKEWVHQNGNDYNADDAWDQYINDNPIVNQDANGKMIVNKDNVGNWRNYVMNKDGSSNQTVDDTQNLDIPSEAIDLLMSDPSAAAMSEFDTQFGSPGLAEKIVKGKSNGRK